MTVQLAPVYGIICKKFGGRSFIFGVTNTLIFFNTGIPEIKIAIPAEHQAFEQKYFAVLLWWYRGSFWLNMNKIWQHLIFDDFVAKKIVEISTLKFDA